MRSVGAGEATSLVVLSQLNSPFPGYLHRLKMRQCFVDLRWLDKFTSWHVAYRDGCFEVLCSDKEAPYGHGCTRFC
jgi:hypothetical protein